jgi:transcriptional regulator with XRE-family HTH domain
VALRVRRSRRAEAARGGDFEKLMRDIEQEARRAGAKATAEYAAFGAYHRLARQVFDLRKAAGLTRRRLAAKTGVRQAAISRIEAGDARPTLATVAALAYALGAELSLRPRGLRKAPERHPVVTASRHSTRVAAARRASSPMASGEGRRRRG